VPDASETQALDEAAVLAARRWPILARGRAIGVGSVSGPARFIAAPEDLSRIVAGEILLVNDVGTDWAGRLGGAVGLVVGQSDSDGRIAALAAEAGLLAVVDAEGGVAPIWSGARLAVCCDPDGSGVVREEPTADRVMETEP